MTHRISLAFLSLAALAGSYLLAHAQSKENFNGFDLVDKTGNIRKPADYRDLYQLLGTYTVLDPKGNQMHVTYASPGTAEYYRKNRKFPDGAVLVKEVFETRYDAETRVLGGVHRGKWFKAWAWLTVPVVIPPVVDDRDLLRMLKDLSVIRVIAGIMSFGWADRPVAC